MRLSFLLPEITVIFLIIFSIIILNHLVLPNINFKNKIYVQKSLNILAIISYAAITSLIIIFYTSTGLIINYDFLAVIIFILFSLYGSNLFSRSTEKIFTYTVFLLPLIISFLIFYFIYNGDKIYKLSRYCKVTDNPKIVFCEYSNGSYIGEMKSFRRHGQGMYIWHSGKTYEGAWKNNLMDGEGEMTDNGNTVRGIWKKHKLVK